MTNPTPTTAGPNSRACADFDGVDDYLDTELPLSDFINADAAYIIISCMIDAVTLTNILAYDNHCIIGDASKFTGIYASALSTLTVNAANFDGNLDTAGSTFAATVIPLVLSLRHESSALYLRINNGANIPVASGNTSTLTGDLRLAMSGAGTNANIKVFECATFDCVPPEGTRNALEQDFMAWIGAELLDEPFLNARLAGASSLSANATVV